LVVVFVIFAGEDEIHDLLSAWEGANVRR